MSFALLLPLLLTIVEQATKPETIESVKKIWELLSSNDTPTEEEQKKFDDALEAAHKAVQEM